MLDVFPRILIGPLFNPGVIGRYLGHPCVQTFMSGSAQDFRPPYDLYYDIQTDTINSFLERLPGPLPDFLIWWDGVYQAIPPGIASCPIPTVLIPGDWNLQLSTLWPYLDLFDHVLADKALLQWMEKGGYDHGLFWPGFSFEPLKHRRLPDVERIYDLTFVGNLNHYVQRERGYLLERIARLSDRYRIQILGGVYGEDYVKLLNQSKIVFNYTICQTMNMRAYEAPACGALLLIEAHNLEIRDFLTDGVSCVLYTSENLEAQIDYYLQHDQERAQIAAEGQRQIQKYSYEKQFEWLLSLLAQLKGAPLRKKPQAPLLLQTRQIFRSSTPLAPLRAILELNQHPCSSSAEHANQLGVFLLHEIYRWGEGGQLTLDSAFRANAEEARKAFERALCLQPENPVLLFNHAWCLELLADPLAKSAYQALYQRLCGPLVPGWEQSLPIYPERYTHFEVEWETRFRFSLSLGNNDLTSLRALLKWQVCLRLAALSLGSPAETLKWLIRALIADPDLGEIPYLLALAWKFQGFPKRALIAFQLALRNQPFQTQVWESLLKEYLAQSLWEPALRFVESRLPMLMGFDNLKSERTQYLRWHTVLRVIVLLQQAPDPTQIATVRAALAAFSDPETAQHFLRFYPQLRAQLHEKWHWLFINLEVVWAPALPEPEPDLFPALNRYSGHAPAVQIGPDICPPLAYQRTWLVAEASLWGEISPGQMPCLFPPETLEVYEIEGLGTTGEVERPFHVLVVISDTPSAEEATFLSELATWSQDQPDVSVLLWNPFPVGTADLLLVLDPIFAPFPSAQVTLLTDIQTADHASFLLQKVQVLAGVFLPGKAWYYHWALALGVPLWLRSPDLVLQKAIEPVVWPVSNTPEDWEQRRKGWDKEKADVALWRQMQKNRDSLFKLKRFQTAWEIRQDWIFAKLAEQDEEPLKLV